jgi:hypothetical protein
MFRANDNNHLSFYNVQIVRPMGGGHFQHMGMDTNSTCFKPFIQECCYPRASHYFKPFFSYLLLRWKDFEFGYHLAISPTCQITINSFYNHAHFSHILVCVTYFLVTIHFNKKHHSLKSLSHLVVAQNICKTFFINVTIRGKSKANIKVL